MKNKKKTLIISYICAISATLCWGIHSILIRHLIQEGIDYNNIAITRLIGGALFLWILLCIFQKKQKIKNSFQYDWIFFVGVIGFAFNFFFFHQGLQYTFASHALLIETFSPIFVLIMSLLIFPYRLKELKNSGKTSYLFLVLVLTSIGSSLLLNDSEQSIAQEITLKGDILVGVSTIFFAMFFLSANIVRQRCKQSNLEVTIKFLFFSGIILLPFIDIYSFKTITLIQWSLLAVVTILCTATAYYLWNYATKYINVHSQTILFNLGAINTIIFESLIGDFYISWKIIIATVIIITASIHAQKLTTS